MSEQDRVRWDKKYAERPSRASSPPSPWLEQHLRNLPRGGRALDLACGDGGNALLLASRGTRVIAVDVSPVGLAIGRKVAGPLPIEWVEADLDHYEPQVASFDLVVCFRFLDRKRLFHLVDTALKPGGLFLGETFNQSAAKHPDCHVTNPDYLLAEGEWLRLFPTYEVLAHEESGGMSRYLGRK